MSSTEQRNVTAFERYTYELFNEKRLELAAELIAPLYVRHSRRGALTDTPESYAPQIGALPERFEIDDMVARDDKLAVRYRYYDAANPEVADSELRGTAICIYRFEDGKVAEHWVASRPAEAGPWPNAPLPREQWSIASAETLTPDEEANLATLNRWGDIRHNRGDAFEALSGLVTDLYVVHGPSQTRTIAPAEVVQLATVFAEGHPGFSASYDDPFVVDDRAVARFCYRFPDPPPDGPSVQCGIAIYRFENHRIAEYWQVQLPDDMDWG